MATMFAWEPGITNYINDNTRLAQLWNQLPLDNVNAGAYVDLAYEVERLLEPFDTLSDERLNIIREFDPDFNDPFTDDEKRGIL